jgi:hypothetical protein
MSTKNAARTWSMRDLAVGIVVLFSLAVFVGCASTVPPSRIGDYVTKDAKVPTNSVIAMPDQRPVQAGLLVIADKTHPRSAPVLPDEAMAHFREELRQELDHGLPFTVKDLIQPDGITPSRTGGDLTQFRELGKKHDVEYLALVVVSSTEVEYPTDLNLGGATEGTPGLARDNWALAEFALVDLKTGRTMMQAEGRGWATLLRTYAPLMSSRYPVVYIEPNSQRVYWPPTWEGAPDTLRVASYNLAGKNLVNKISRVWFEYLEGEAAARRSEK